MSKLHHSPCPLCNHPRASIVFPALSSSIKASYSPAASGRELGAIVKCRKCHVIYKDPFPDEETLQEGYEESIDQQYLSLLPERRATFQHVLAFIERYRQRGRILDVGCAEGTLLALAQRHGWKAYGIEPNKHLVRWAKEHYHLNLMQGSVFSPHLKKGSYDVITLLDVIEHVADPVKFLRRCYDLLAPGGLIFISTPDIGSSIARIMRRRWFYILTIHVFYFTRQTLSAVLRKAGFHLLKDHPYLLRTRLSYVADKSRNYLGSLGGLLVWLTRVLGLSEREITYWLGQRMFIGRKQR